MEKDRSHNINQKKTIVAILVIDKTDFRVKKLPETEKHIFSDKE